MQPKQPYVGFTLLDERGAAGRARYSARRGLTVADMMMGADSLGSHLSSLSSCTLTRQSAIYPFIEPFASLPVAGISVDNVAMLIFSTTSPEQYASIALPGIRPEFVLQTGVNAGLVLDIDAEEVSTLVDALVSGLYCNPFGYTLTELAATLVERRP